jgi:hypothetical protein
VVNAAPDRGNADRLERIRRRFREFGTEYAALPLYSAVSLHVADDPATARILLDAQPGQARPVLWLAALHDLVLRSPDLPAARWYASVVGRDRLPEGDPWPDVRETVLAHADELRQMVGTRTTQTNEVNRVVYLAAGLAAAASAMSWARDRSLALVELGASAGLLLGIDRYAITATSVRGETTVGDAASPVRCRGEDRSPEGTSLATLPPIVGRAGVDRSPVSLDDEGAVRWLLACLWPDVPGRVERFEAARALLRQNAPRVVEGDMVDDVGAGIETALGQAPDVGHVVVYSSWALTYVERSRRVELADRLASLAAGLPVLSWLTAEPPGCVPGLPGLTGAAEGPTVLGLRRWSGGAEEPPRVVGVAHPHGAWVETW